MFTYFPVNFIQNKILLKEMHVFLKDKTTKL